MINKTIIIGRLVRDPEMRKTASGTPVAQITVAVDNPANKEGEKTTSFIPCTIWNKLAENVCKHLRKGSLLCVEGRLNQRTYDSKDGRHVTVIEVLAENIQFLDSKKDDASTAVKDNNTASTKADDDSVVTAVTDDDLPF